MISEDKLEVGFGKDKQIAKIIKSKSIKIPRVKKIKTSWDFRYYKYLVIYYKLLTIANQLINFYNLNTFIKHINPTFYRL